jgi:hypothetical protein
MGAVIVFLLGYLMFSVYKIEGLRTELLESKNSTLIAEKQSNEYKSALDLQSLEIEHLRVDVNTSKTKLEQWKALPAQIRYETIYKYIPKQVILERGDCNDTKMLIDSIRAIDFNSL